VDSTLHRYPDVKNLGNWGYAVSLYLYGQYLLYQRTRDKAYLDYIQGWIDHHVNDDGVIDRKVTALDYMLPGNLLLILYRETKQEKYRKAAESIRQSFDSYPRSEDGGLWHAYSRQHQLWLDGMYMSMPFLVRYGKAFGDEKYAYDEAVKQLLIYAKHLNDPASGLMFHAYDESGAQPWADPVTHHSAFFWCRAIGWFGMALIEVLQILPHAHAQREELIALVQQLTKAYAKYQDPATGRWFQIVDKPTIDGNWLETSSSSMYVYTIAKAVERRYIAKSFSRTACKGYRGVLSQLSLDAAGEAHIANICDGTNVGDLNYYLQRQRKTDDFHGLGAFLIMNEQMRRVGCTADR
jgi:unsaturated rhamnogalacturonyl hydrolase